MGFLSNLGKAASVAGEFGSDVAEATKLLKEYNNLDDNTLKSIRSNGSRAEKSAAKQVLKDRA